MPRYELMAGLLDYPDAGLPDRVKACRAALNGGAAESLDRFEAAIEPLAQGAREELYTATFDMVADRSLYVGHHLFGEDARRGIFLVKLKEHYRAHGVDSGRELPDHLCVMLRFLDGSEPDAEASELVHDCIVPALQKAFRGAAEAGSAYAAALEAILLALDGEARS